MWNPKDYRLIARTVRTSDDRRFLEEIFTYEKLWKKPLHPVSTPARLSLIHI